MVLDEYISKRGVLYISNLPKTLEYGYGEIELSFIYKDKKKKLCRYKEKVTEKSKSLLITYFLYINRLKNLSEEYSEVLMGNGGRLSFSLMGKESEKKMLNPGKSLPRMLKIKQKKLNSEEKGDLTFKEGVGGESDGGKMLEYISEHLMKPVKPVKKVDYRIGKETVFQ